MPGEAGPKPSRAQQSPRLAVVSQCRAKPGPSPAEPSRVQQFSSCSDNNAGRSRARAQLSPADTCNVVIVTVAVAAVVAAVAASARRCDLDDDNVNEEDYDDYLDHYDYDVILLGSAGLGPGFARQCFCYS